MISIYDPVIAYSWLYIFLFHSYHWEGDTVCIYPSHFWKQRVMYYTVKVADLTFQFNPFKTEFTIEISVHCKYVENEDDLWSKKFAIYMYCSNSFRLGIHH